MTGDVVYSALRGHVRRFFEGHHLAESAFPHGPAGRTPVDFRVVHVSPGPRSPAHVYLSLGSWESATDEHGLEFVIATNEPEPACVELLAMVAYYHSTRGLDIGHTVPLGYPWRGGTCDHFLVCLPYPFGPDLEICCLGETGHVRFLWLMPVTAAEKTFRHEHGLEALESRFEEAGTDYTAPARPSVV